jgi:hypothetical protein
MEPLLDVFFLFDSVLLDLYPGMCRRDVTLINVINKCCTLFVFIFLYGFLVLLRQGIARGSPPGTTTEVQRVGFPSTEIWFVSGADGFYLPVFFSTSYFLGKK